MKRMNVIGTALLLSLCLLFPSCLAECEDSREEMNEMGQVSFRVSMEQTKSILGATAGDTSIEGKLRDVCWAFYNSRGYIEKMGYSEQAGTIVASVRKAETYTLLVLANMGDLKDSFPAHIDDTLSMEYVLPSFESVSDKGIPMSGRFRNVSVDNQPGTVYLDRLFAKIYLRVDKSIIAGMCGLEGEYSVGGLKSGSVFLRNCNARLRPFGDSRASGPEDILRTADRMEDMNDIADLMAESGMSQERIEELWGTGPAYAMDTTLVFYVPENLQGNLLTGSDPWGKTADAIGAEKAAKCTYLEYSLDIAMGVVGGFGGNVKYRFFLGDDATKNFDVRRNSVYNVHLSITAEGTLKDNWKVERGDDFSMGLQLDWLEDTEAWKRGTAPEYIGQGGILTVEGTMNQTSVTVEPPELARVTANEDGSYEVYAMGSGTVKITIYDSGDDRIKGQTIFDIKVPEASLTSPVSLNPDGTYVNFVPSYLKSDKTALDLSTLHPDAYDDFYRPVLLKSEGKYIPYLKFDSNRKLIYFCRSSDAMISAAGSNTHRMSFGTEKILKECTFDVNCVDPFENISVQALPDIDNCSMLANTDIPVSFLENIAAYRSWRDLSVSIRHDNVINCASSSLIAYEVRPDGNSWNPSATSAFIFTDITRIDCRMKSNLRDNTPAIGPHTVVAKVYNKHMASDYVSRVVASFDSYVHVCVGAERSYTGKYRGDTPAGRTSISELNHCRVFVGDKFNGSFFDQYFSTGYVGVKFLHDDVRGDGSTSPLLQRLGKGPASSNDNAYGCNSIVACSGNFENRDYAHPYYSSSRHKSPDHGTVDLYEAGNPGTVDRNLYSGMGTKLFRVTRLATSAWDTLALDDGWKELLEVDNIHKPKYNILAWDGEKYDTNASVPVPYTWNGGPDTAYLKIYKLEDIYVPSNGWIDNL